MVRVASSETVRFTPDQRDALLDVAARLQAEHEATLTAEDLAHAAREAGIDPRYLAPAADLLGRSAPRSSLISPAEPLLALAGLLVFDWLLLGVLARGWLMPVGPLRLPLLVASGALFAVRFGRNRELRWIAPLAVAVVWVVLAIGSWSLLRLTHFNGWAEIPRLAAAFALVQGVSAAAAAGIAARLERRTR